MSLCLCQIFGLGKSLAVSSYSRCVCLCVRSLERARSLAVLSYSRCVFVSVSDLWTGQEALAISSYSRCVCVSVSDLWTGQEAWQSYPIHDMSLSLCQIFGPGKKLGSLILFTMCLCLCVRSLDRARSLAVSSYSRCVCVSVSDLWTRQEAWQSHPIHDVSVSLCQIFGPGKKLGSLILFTMCLLIITSCVSLQLFCSIKDFHKFETFPQVSYFFMTFPRCFFHNFIYVLMVCDMTPERSF